MTGYEEFWAKHRELEEREARLSYEQRSRLPSIVRQRTVDYVIDKWGKYGVMAVMLALGGGTLQFFLTAFVLTLIYPAAAVASATIVNRDEYHRIKDECITELELVQ